ncbi:DUF2589 domain-containing protein [Couchioplanes caeruleus]|uniref:DUF2589 domain-containing protein n=1 Tax=Couchioplanes caeruleus TaxID=56438 RepID=UPI0020BE5BAC|nr:DUF2589 domain-containing protein [Couchioplanes caeruleus]UQU66642.1 DUF2589 domain-containing protein [Couchioplanes caeruleus]
MTSSNSPEQHNVDATTRSAAPAAAGPADPATASLAVPSGDLPAGQVAVSPAEATADTGRAAAQLGATLAAAAAPQGLDAPTTNFTSELNNIDFKKMIGGPLQAAVDAQVASSLATIDFINKVGFTDVATTGPEPADGQPVAIKRELVMVDFSHKRTDLDKDGNPGTTKIFVRVPLLAMLPIPSLRIEQVVIDFNVKLNSVETASVSDQLKVGAEVGGGFGPVNFKVSASYQRQTSTNVEVKKEYALNVNVKAVQDEIPAGLEKILGMLSA